jgi:hypothetical protein
VYRIDHDPDRHDDRAIALALAAQMLVGDTWGRPERPARTEWASTRDRVIEELWERETGEIDRADRRRGVDRSGWSV